MNSHNQKAMILKVSPGEVIQILGMKPGICKVSLDTKISTKCVALSPTDRLDSSTYWKIYPHDTVVSLLNRWLADVSFISVPEVLEDLGLQDAATMPMSAWDLDIYFRLTVLKAILEGYNVLELSSVEDLSNLTEFIINIQSFMTDHLDRENSVSIIIYEGDSVPGITLIADKVLMYKQNKLSELEVVF